jgi:FMN phosphatase YigB (HAD superfamily)
MQKPPAKLLFMPLLLDLFGVVMQHTLNTPLLSTVQSFRQHGQNPLSGVYLASNMGSPEKAAMCHKHPALMSQLDGIFYSGALGFAKPNPLFYQAIGQTLGAKPQHLLFFDDSPTNVAAAAQQGWHSFVYESPTQVAMLAKNYLAPNYLTE